jgi:hypothetical protein
MVMDDPFPFVHGDPRIIAHLLPGSGQGIEECGFAGVGISGQGESQFLGHRKPRGDFFQVKVLRSRGCLPETISARFWEVKKKFGSPNFLLSLF